MAICPGLLYCCQLDEQSSWCQLTVDMTLHILGATKPVGILDL